MSVGPCVPGLPIGADVRRSAAETNLVCKVSAEAGEVGRNADDLFGPRVVDGGARSGVPGESCEVVGFLIEDFGPGQLVLLLGAACVSFHPPPCDCGNVE